jgi:murein DD-endopeptidase MepM/ murein hydrolase activator NlpD
MSHRRALLAVATAVVAVLAAPVAAVGQTEDPEPEPLPTVSPTPTPTPTPTATTPTPTASPTTTAPSAGGGSSPSPTSQPAPAPVPAPAPAPSPPAAPRPGAIVAPPGATPEQVLVTTQLEELRSALVDQAHSQLDASAQRLLDASSGLAAAASDLAGASAFLAEARARADDADRAAAAAGTRLAQAEARRARAHRQMLALGERLEETTRSLGIVASTAYRTGGFDTLNVVLGSQTPQELLDNVVGMEAVLRADGSVLAELAAERAELTDAGQRLTALIAAEAQARDAAESARVEARATREEAEVVEQELAALVASTHADVVSATAELDTDLARYASFVQESAVLTDALSARAASAGPIPVGAAVGTGSFVRPGTGELTSAFGYRRHPILGYVKLHTGADLGRGDGWVYAADDGVVIEARFQTAYGNMTVIHHGPAGDRDLTTVYAHQATFLVEPGDVVRKGQRIGLIGSTGYSTGPHLHFEVRLDGHPVDPWPSIRTAPLP